MRRLMIGLIAVLALTACTPKADTTQSAGPKRQYYALMELDVALMTSANVALQDCLKRTASHPCRKGIVPLQNAVMLTRKTFASTDKIFLGGDPTYYSMALQIARNALDGLKGSIAVVKTP